MTLVVVRMKYQSAPCVPSHAKRRGRVASVPRALGHLSAGLNHRQLRERLEHVFSIVARLSRIFSGTGNMGRILNLIGPSKAARRLFSRTLRKFFQEPRSVITILFGPSPLCVVAHEQDTTTGAFPNERISEARHGIFTARDGKNAC